MIISIITPTFRRLSFIRKLYSELLKIECKKNLEWIVVYEKNDLDTITFLKKIKLDDQININLVKNNKAPTTGNLFNQGAIKARGEIISFLGDDDIILTNTIELVLSSFKENPHKDWLIGFGGYHTVDNKKTRNLLLYFKSFLLRNFLTQKYLSIVNFIMTPSVFIKKRFFLKNGLWNINNKYSNDYEFWLKLLGKQRPIILQKKLSSTGVILSTITSRFNINKYFILLQIGFKYLEKFSIYKILVILSVFIIFFVHIINLFLNTFRNRIETFDLKSSNKKKSILHITRLFGENEYGGIQKLISLIVEKNSSLEFSIVATHSHKTCIKYLKMGAKKIKIYYFKRSFIHKQNIFSFDFLINFNKVVKNYDILHFHYPWPYADLFFLLNNLIFNYKKKIVLTYHADIVGRYFLKIAYFVFLRYFFFKKVNIFHFTTLKYRKVSESNLKNKNIFISSIGLTSKNMQVAKNKVRGSIIQLKKKDKIILFVGADRHYKGGNLLASIVNRLKNKKIIILTNNKIFKKKYRISNKKCKVYYKVNDQEKNYLLSISRLLLFTSTNKAESLGVILLEAFYYGLPVVAFKINTGSLELLKNKYNSFIVKLYDLENFLKRINILYNNDKVHKKMSINAKSTFKKKYTFSNQKMLDLYN